MTKVMYSNGAGSKKFIPNGFSEALEEWMSVNKVRSPELITRMPKDKHGNSPSVKMIHNILYKKNVRTDKHILGALANIIGFDINACNSQAEILSSVPSDNVNKNTVLSMQKLNAAQNEALEFLASFNLRKTEMAVGFLRLIANVEID